MKIRKLIILFSATILTSATLASCSSSKEPMSETGDSRTSQTMESTKEGKKILQM